MLQKFKITFYAIMVALAAVLVLPVNAAELQLVSPTGIQVAQKKKGMGANLEGADLKFANLEGTDLNRRT